MKYWVAFRRNVLPYFRHDAVASADDSAARRALTTKSCPQSKVVYPECRILNKRYVALGCPLRVGSRHSRHLMGFYFGTPPCRADGLQRVNPALR